MTPHPPFKWPGLPLSPRTQLLFSPPISLYPSPALFFFLFPLKVGRSPLFLFRFTPPLPPNREGISPSGQSKTSLSLCYCRFDRRFFCKAPFFPPFSGRAGLPLFFVATPPGLWTECSFSFFPSRARGSFFWVRPSPAASFSPHGRTARFRLLFLEMAPPSRIGKNFFPKENLFYFFMALLKPFFPLLGWRFPPPFRVHQRFPLPPHKNGALPPLGFFPKMGLPLFPFYFFLVASPPFFNLPP